MKRRLAVCTRAAPRGTTPLLLCGRPHGSAMAAVADVDKDASEMLFRLMIRASSHYDRAVRAYAKAARRCARARG